MSSLVMARFETKAWIWGHSETFCFLPLWLAITRPVAEQVDLPSWGQAEKVERDLEGLLEGSTWSVTHMQQEAQWGPSCPESRQGPTFNFFFLYLLAELNLGQFIKKIQLNCYVLDSSIFIFQTFLVCLKLPWNILVLCNIFKLWKQKISIAQRAKESLAKKYLMNSPNKKENWIHLLMPFAFFVVTLGF